MRKTYRNVLKLGNAIILLYLLVFLFGVLFHPAWIKEVYSSSMCFKQPLPLNLALTVLFIMLMTSVVPILVLIPNWNRKKKLIENIKVSINSEKSEYYSDVDSFLILILHIFTLTQVLRCS